MPGQEGSSDRIDYKDKDGGQHHKRGGVTTTTCNESSCRTTQGCNDGEDDGSVDVMLCLEPFDRPRDSTTRKEHAVFR